VKRVPISHSILQGTKLFLQQFIFLVISPWSTGHWVYYILCVLPLPILVNKATSRKCDALAGNCWITGEDMTELKPVMRAKPAHPVQVDVD